MQNKRSDLQYGENKLSHELFLMHCLRESTGHRVRETEDEDEGVVGWCCLLLIGAPNLDTLKL